MLIITAVSVVLVLWLNGRLVRSTWYDRVSIHPLQTTRHDPKKMHEAIFTITGAFTGPPHLERLEREWAKRATVYRVHYPIEIFNMKNAVEDVYRAIRVSESELGHRRFYIMGYSLGGLIGLLVWMYALKRDPEFARTKLRLIVHDSPLGFQHLLLPGGTRIPSRLSRLWRWLGANIWWMVRPGPLTNFIARPFVPVAFPYLPVGLQDAGADQDQIRRHRIFLARNRAALLVSQIAAIGSVRDVIGDEQLPVVLVCCALDEVVTGDDIQTDWRGLFPQLHVISLPSNTRHVSVPENHQSYSNAGAEAFAWFESLQPAI